MRKRVGDEIPQVVAALRALDASLDLLDASVAAVVGIGRSDLRAMELVSRHGRLTSGELATQLHLTTGSVTTLVDRMERIGYLQRRNHAADRRKVVIELTAKGRERERRVYGPLAREAVKTLSRYGERDLAVIRDFLQNAGALADAARARLVSHGRRE